MGGGHFKGEIDEVRLYGRTITLAEVQSRAQNQPVATYVYDALSRRASLTLPNGIQTIYTYDPASQVTAISHQLTAISQQINKAEYGYNAVGNRTSLTDRRGPLTFGYDQLDRLTSASHPLLLDPQAFAYDAVGNRITGGSVVNAGNQLTGDANFGYQYDDNGNLTRKTLLATGNYTQYTYDPENRLIQVQEFAAGNPTAITTSSYRYDGLGRRIEKVANGQTKRYVYDGEDILLEYDGSNVLQARYTHGPGIDEPIAVTKVGSMFYYHQDGLGTVTELTDINGSVAKAYAYDAYGSMLESPGTVEQPYTYTGREFDAETGLYYYRERYYDSGTGRFLHKDPIGVLGGINLYQYVAANPVLHNDPRGLLAPWRHRQVTRDALANLGRSCKEFGADLPEAVSDVDLAPGSQEKANAIWHSMTPKGQAAEEATADWDRYVTGNLESCTTDGLARILHAGQDYPAGGHGFKNYRGAVLEIPAVGLSHIIDDWFPGDQVLAQARIISQGFISQWIQRCGCTCPNR